MTPNPRGAILATGLACCLSVPALADVDQPLATQGWQEMTFDGKTTNRFALTKDGALQVDSDGSVSVLQKPLSIDIEATPILRWRWCVTEPAPATDLAIKGEDDRSLAVYVAFPFVPEEASAFEKLERKIVEKTAGPNTPGRILMYVFGGQGERGTIVPSPHLGEAGMMQILRPGGTPAGEWFEETIDITDDYRKAFGTEPPNPMSLAISADTDDTDSHSRGLVIDLGFVGEQRVF